MLDTEFSRSADPDHLDIYSDFRAGAILREWDQDNRYNCPVSIPDPEQAARVAEIRDSLDADMEPYANRRRIERDLADYIDRVSCSAHGTLEFRKIIERMRTCRCNAPVGIKPDGGKIFAWDCKCGLIRLCPDEARADTQRIAEKYVPHITAWAKRKPTRRLFYLVPTSPNFPAGDLLAGKRWQFQAFREFIEHEYIAERFGGALVVQEDPLSAGHDWNVHLNVILGIEGEFDFAKVREAWGFNVHIELLPKNTEDLTRAVLELVKYSAMHMGIKSQKKFDEITTAPGGDMDRLPGGAELVAPPLTQWPFPLFIEWWQAQRPTSKKGGRATTFRRVRSYGDFYKVEYKPEKLDLNSVIWIGSIEYGADGHYRSRLKQAVALILEDNFSKTDRRQDNLRGFWRESGPPDRGK
jgi:hypothetical protein